MLKILGIITGTLSIIMLGLMITGKISFYNLFLIIGIIAFSIVFFAIDWKIKDEQKLKKMDVSARQSIEKTREIQFEQSSNNIFGLRMISLVFGILVFIIILIVDYIS